MLRQLLGFLGDAATPWNSRDRNCLPCGGDAVGKAWEQVQAQLSSALSSVIPLSLQLSVLFSELFFNVIFLSEPRAACRVLSQLPLPALCPSGMPLPTPWPNQRI